MKTVPEIDKQSVPWASEGASEEGPGGGGGSELVEDSRVAGDDCCCCWITLNCCKIDAWAACCWSSLTLSATTADINSVTEEGKLVQP